MKPYVSTILSAGCGPREHGRTAIEDLPCLIPVVNAIVALLGIDNRKAVVDWLPERVGVKGADKLEVRLDFIAEMTCDDRAWQENADLQPTSVFKYYESLADFAAEDAKLDGYKLSVASLFDLMRIMNTFILE